MILAIDMLLTVDNRDFSTTYYITAWIDFNRFPGKN